MQAGLNLFSRYAIISAAPATLSTRVDCQPGEVPERLNGTVSKTVVVLVATVGSNPTLSAGAPCAYLPNLAGRPFYALLAGHTPCSRASWRVTR